MGNAQVSDLRIFDGFVPTLDVLGAVSPPTSACSAVTINRMQHTRVKLGHASTSPGGHGHVLRLVACVRLRCLAAAPTLCISVPVTPWLYWRTSSAPPVPTRPLTNLSAHMSVAPMRHPVHHSRTSCCLAATPSPAGAASQTPQEWQSPRARPLYPSCSYVCLVNKRLPLSLPVRSFPSASARRWLSAADKEVMGRSRYGTVRVSTRARRVSVVRSDNSI